MTLFRLVTAVTLVALGLNQAAAQPPRINRTLARQLGESAEGAEPHIWISIPTHQESLLGAIVTPENGGFTVVARVPANLYDIEETWKAEFPVSDAVIPKADSLLAEKFVKGMPRLQKSYKAFFEAEDVKLHSVVPKDSNAFAKFVKSSQAVTAAARSGKKLYFVKAAYEGQVKLHLGFKEKLAREVTSARPDFRMAPLDERGSEADFKSQKAVEFAYQFDAVELTLGGKTTPTALKLAPAPAPKLPTLWEAQPPPMAAMVAPEEGPEIGSKTIPKEGPREARKDNFVRATVFYASDRSFGPTTPASRRQAFWLCLFSYFLTLQGGGLAAVCLLTAAALPFFSAVRQKLGASGLVAVAAVLVSIPLGLAVLYSYQNYEGTIALRGDMSQGLSYGTCDVSIPFNHTRGTLDPAMSILLIRIEREDPEENVVLLERKPLAPGPFFTALDARLEESPQRECFVFLHGYNNSFEDAAKRTAQLWYDLEFPGAPIFFSWPSQGNRAGYTFDENNALWARPHFEQFLAELHAKTKAQRIHVVAHSMGNRILADTLERLAARGKLGENGCRIQEVVFAAPDIDRGTLEQQVPNFLVPQRTRPHFTLYASKNDAALQASRDFHNEQRAGDTTGGILCAAGLDSIDASLLDTSLDNHGYIAAHQSVVKDLNAVMQGQKTLQRKWLEEAMQKSDKYWIFRPSEQP